MIDKPSGDAADKASFWGLVRVSISRGCKRPRRECRCNCSRLLRWISALDSMGPLLALFLPPFVLLVFPQPLLVLSGIDSRWERGNTPFLPPSAGAVSEKLGFGPGSLFALLALLVLSGPPLECFLLLAATFFAGDALIIIISHGTELENRLIINGRT